MSVTFADTGMDPKLAMKPCIVLQKMPSSVMIKGEVDAEDVPNDAKEYLSMIKGEVDAEDVPNDVTDILTSRVHCQFCSHTFSSTSARSRHEKKHEDKNRRIFRCKFCTKSYTRAEHLRRHMRSHTGEKPHKCDSCGKQFADRSKLVQHHRIHTNERPYKCSKCDKAFRQYGSWQHHRRQHTLPRLPTGIRYARTRETPLYVCVICDKILTTNRSLKSHIRIVHTGEKPYKCEYCGDAFASRQGYFYHRKALHEETRYECPDCGRRFAALWMMKNHAMVHEMDKNYVCFECGKSEHQPMWLKYHLWRHFGGMQTCHICGKILCNPLQLRLHLKGHLFAKVEKKPERLFDCGECGKQFTKRKLVVRHFTTCHTKSHSVVKTEVKTELQE